MQDAVSGQMQTFTEMDLDVTEHCINLGHANPHQR